MTGILLLIVGALPAIAQPAACPDLFRSPPRCAQGGAEFPNCSRPDAGSLAGMLAQGFVDYDPKSGLIYTSVGAQRSNHRSWSWHQAPAPGNTRAWCADKGWLLDAHPARPPRSRPGRATARCIDGSSGGIDYSRFPSCESATMEVLQQAQNAALAGVGQAVAPDPVTEGAGEGGPAASVSVGQARPVEGAGAGVGATAEGARTTAAAPPPSPPLESGPKSAGLPGKVFGTTAPAATAGGSGATASRSGGGAGGAGGGCGECTHGCGDQFWAAVERRPIDRACIAKCTGSPTSMFTRGGSMNWPPVCKAAEYLTDHDPAWFEGYFAAQGPGGVAGIGGTEMFSPMYMNAPLGAVLAVLKEAQTRHPSLAASARAWLRAGWALQALAALPTPIRKAWVHRGNGDVQALAVEPRGGLSLGLAGPRVRHPETGPNSVNHRSVTMALDYKPRSGKISGRRMFILAGIQYMLETAGFRSPGGNLNDRSVPPELVGLTASERDTLTGLAVSGQGLGAALSMISPFRAACPITFRRTTEGIATWFGSSAEDGHNCNGNKPPIFAVTLTNSGEAHYLFPEHKIVGAPRGRSWRDGDKVCAQAGSTGAQDCLALPGGALVYEVYFDKSGAKVVSGDVSGGPDPSPGPGPRPGPREYPRPGPRFDP